MFIILQCKRVDILYIFYERYYFDIYNRGLNKIKHSNDSTCNTYTHAVNLDKIILVNTMGFEDKKPFSKYNSLPVIIYMARSFYNAGNPLVFSFLFKFPHTDPNSET